MHGQILLQINTQKLDRLVNETRLGYYELNKIILATGDYHKPVKQAIAATTGCAARRRQHKLFQLPLKVCLFGKGRSCILSGSRRAIRSARKMNAKNLTVSAVYALYFGFFVIFMKLQLPGILWAIILAIWPPLLRYWLIRRRMKVFEDAHKTNDTLFAEKIAVVTSVVMFIIAIGVTYILLNHVFDFQPHNFACGVADFGRRRAPSFQCTERLILTAIYCLTFFSLIAAMWSLARRYLVREHWDEL